MRCSQASPFPLRDGVLCGVDDPLESSRPVMARRSPDRITSEHIESRRSQIPNSQFVRFSPFCMFIHFRNSLETLKQSFWQPCLTVSVKSFSFSM